MVFCDLLRRRVMCRGPCVVCSNGFCCCSATQMDPREGGVEPRASELLHSDAFLQHDTPRFSHVHFSCLITAAICLALRESGCCTRYLPKQRKRGWRRHSESDPLCTTTVDLSNTTSSHLEQLRCLHVLQDSAMALGLPRCKTSPICLVTR